jgi:hypothetical protein
MFLFSAICGNESRAGVFLIDLCNDTSHNDVSSHDMCMRIVEKFPVCGCIYYTHSVDRCSYYGRHAVVEKVIWVGASCPQHRGG